MKTAVSIPDALFKRSEKLARKMKVSRSQFYARALGEYLKADERASLERSLREVYGEVDSSLDPAVMAAQMETLTREKW